MIWTPPQLVKWISNDLENKGFPPPHRFEAELLVSHALNISRLDIYLQHDKPCTKEEQERLRDLLKRRYNREPVAYILESADFWTLSLKVGPGVLIPRQETEILVEAALENIPELSAKNSFSILELGAGSAAIPLALCSERSDLKIISTELSDKAIKYALENLSKYNHLLHPKNNHIYLIRTDKFSAINPGFTVEMIISNPPYIASETINSLQQEVSKWEPSLALSGGTDGMDFYRYLFKAADEFLKSGGYLIFEHGYDQSDVISSLVEKEPALGSLHIRKDYSGHNRVMVIQKI